MSDQKVKITVESVASFGDNTPPKPGEKPGPSFQLKGQAMVYGGPLTFSVGSVEPFQIAEIWNAISDGLKDVFGVSLPAIDTNAPWGDIFTADIYPALWLEPDNNGKSNISFQLTVSEDTPIHIGGPVGHIGPVDITIEPEFTINSVMVGYDKVSGLGISASVTMPTTKGKSAKESDPPSTVTKIVKYPFPIPEQKKKSKFVIHYLGLGQRVGPKPITNTGVSDPLAAIFKEIEDNFDTNDPTEMLTRVATEFYDPKLGWFIAADLSIVSFRIRAIFNDPSMYGLEITVHAEKGQKPSIFEGLRFEILYQKLGPNLGVYFAAVDLPIIMRRIPIYPFVLILPGFSLWIYTNGDFRINVGWPIGKNSIGISWEILTGWIGFYFAKLRSGDDPGAHPTNDFNPILALGIAFRLEAGVSINAGVFSASLSISVTVTFQGLLAWYNGKTVANAPDAYWFAGTFEIQVLVKGSVDFVVIKVSVSIGLSFKTDIAMENGYGTELVIHAQVTARASVKIIFFTVHFSFHTTITHGIQLSTGPNGVASVNGPQESGLSGLIGSPQVDLNTLMMRSSQTRSDLAPLMRDIHEPLVPPLRLSPQRRARGRVQPLMMAAVPDAVTTTAPKAVTVNAKFVLQGTAVYPSGTGDPAFGAVGMILLEGRDPDSPVTDDLNTDFEGIVSHLVCWLLNNTATADSADAHLSTRLKTLSDALQNTEALAFRDQIDSFFSQEVSITIVGVDGTVAPPADDPDAKKTWTILPMFDILQMTLGPTTHDFNTLNPLPSTYGNAVDLYFEGLSLFGGKSSPLAAEDAADDAVDSSPTMASFLYADYYLMLAQHVVTELYQAAQVYEKNASDALAQNGASDEGGAVNAHVLATDDQNELDTLLNEYNYASAAGFVSRAMAGGQQLPVPSAVKAHTDPITPANVHDLPVDGMYALTGQLIAVAPSGKEQTVSATLDIAKDLTLPDWLTLDSDAEKAATAKLALPASVPAQPAPSWTGTGLSTIPAGLQPAGDAGTIALADIDPVAEVGLKLSTRSQSVWAEPGGTKAAIVPLPTPLQALVDAQTAATLKLTVAQDPSSTDAPVGVTGSPALTFDLPISQVSAPQGKTSAGTTGTAVVPNLYQIWATDDVSRELIRQVIDGADANSAPSISLLYIDKDGKTLQSDTLEQTTLLSRSNLSTQNQSKPSPMVAMVALDEVADDDDADTTDPAFAPISKDPIGALRLIWEVSVVNASGFYLHYRTDQGDGLPDRLFAQTGTDDDTGQSTAIDGTSGAMATLRVLVAFNDAPVQSVAMQVGTNSIVAEGFVGKTASMAAYDSGGAEIPSWHSRFGPGEVGFRLDWTDQNVTPPVIGQLNAASIYSLIQFNVNDLSGSQGAVWSLPLTPIQDDAPATNDLVGSGTPAPLSETPKLLAQTDAQSYQQVFPAYRFIESNRKDASDENVYALVGRTVTTSFRLADLFGNALAEQATATQQGYYHDPLINVTQWPMVQSSHYFRQVTGDGAGEKAQLVVCLTFDADGLEKMVNAVNASSNKGDPKTQLTALIQRYTLIQDQISDPNTTYSLSTTLVGGAEVAVDLETQLSGFVADIIDQINIRLSADQSGGTTPKKSTLVLPLTADILFSDINALTDNIFSVETNITCARSSHLWPGVDDKIPEVKQSIAQIAPSRTIPDAGDGLCPTDSDPSDTTSGILAYAQSLEAAFANFNGKGGMLKTAERAGQRADANSDSVPTLWAVRFAGTDTEGPGITTTFESKGITYYALPPLNTDPVNQVVDGVSYSGIDMDAWSRGCFRDIDRLFEPELSVGIAVLESRLAPAKSAAAQLTQAKSNLAEYVPKTLEHVFAGDSGGSAKDARDQLTQAMLNRLSAAYDVSTILQAPAQVTFRNASGPVDADSSRPPQLFGRVGPKLVDPTQAGDDVSSAPMVDQGAATPTQSGEKSEVYDLSSGRLNLSNGENWSTVLVTVTDQRAQSHLDLELEYNVTALQHDFEASEEFDGYTPSTWLNFVIPGDMLNTTISADQVSIPIPLPFEPQAPSLTRQQASGSPTDWSPTEGITKLIEEALNWTYETSLMQPNGLAGQDQLYFDAIFGIGAVPPRNSQDLPTNSINTQLFDAMARFRVAWATFETLIPQIIAAANSDDLPQNAETLYEAVATIAEKTQAVATAWMPAPQIMAFATLEPPEIIHYRLQMQRDQDDQSQLDFSFEGWSEGPQAQHLEPSRWPVISFVPQTGGNQLQPWPTDTTGISEQDGWWKLTTKQSASDVPQNMTFTWADLSLSQRQLGRLRSWVVRNADLVEGRTVNPNFIYETEEVSFASPGVPMIQRTALPVVTIKPNDPVLQTILTQILTPLDFGDETLAPYIRFNADLAYVIADVPPEGPILATVPLILQPNLVLGDVSGGVTPEAAAKSLTNGISAGFDRFVGRGTTLYLDLSITLFGSEADQQVPLIVIDPLRLDVTAVPGMWWKPTA